MGFKDPDTFVYNILGGNKVLYYDVHNAESQGYANVSRNEGESTKEFIRRIAQESGVNEREAVTMFLNQRTRNTFNNLVTYMTSLVEINPMIGQRNYAGSKEKTADGKSIPRTVFFAARYAGPKVIFKSTIVENIIELVRGNRISFDLIRENLRVLKGKNKPSREELLEPIKALTTLIRLGDTEVAAVNYDLKRFNRVLGDVITKFDSSSDISKNIESFLKGDQPNKMTTMLAEFISNADKRKTPTSVKGADGKSIYKRIRSSFGREVYNRFIKGAANSLFADESITKSPFLKNNIFVKGMNKLHEVIDFDTTGWAKLDNNTAQHEETPEKWLDRTFAFAFGSALKKKKRNEGEGDTYYQPVYTISNKKKLIAGKVNYLTPKEIKSAISSIIIQEIERPTGGVYDQVGLYVKNRDKFSIIGLRGQSTSIAQAVDVGELTEIVYEAMKEEASKKSHLLDTVDIMRDPNMVSAIAQRVGLQA